MLLSEEVFGPECRTAADYILTRPASAYPRVRKADEGKALPYDFNYSGADPPADGDGEVFWCIVSCMPPVGVPSQKVHS